VLLGSSALEDGSRFGLNVVFAHEAYRNGIDDGEAGQMLETTRAIMGHIDTAMGLMQSYGQGVIGETLAGEAKDFYKAILAYQRDTNDIEALTALVGILTAYDSSKDFWLLKKDGTLADDGSADLHWEAVTKGTTDDGDPIYKTIMSFNGMTKEESLVAILGGGAKARAILEANNITTSDNLSNTELGAIIAATLNTGTGGSLDIAYSEFKDNLNRDWQSIYQSYSDNIAFYTAYGSGDFHGNQDVLKRENNGDTVTTDLEYYSLLYDPLKKALGITDNSDPLQVLQSRVHEFTHPGMIGKLMVNDSIREGLTAAFDATLAQGETIPTLDGGGGSLRLRFINTAQGLYLSEHATGEAVDFDPKNNDQYFLTNFAQTNESFNAYLGIQLGKNPKEVRGWEENTALVELYRNYPVYLDNQIARVQSDLKYYQQFAVGRQDELTAVRLAEELNRLEATREQIRLTSLSFTMNKIFVENMRQYFTWGGDWWEQKDYMHFETR
jgi:hypothetical protein